MTESELLEQKYRNGYLGEGGLYCPCNSEEFYNLIDFLDKYRDDLPRNDIKFITSHFGIKSLGIICDHKNRCFDKLYISIFQHIVFDIVNYHCEIDKPSFMEYIQPCISYYYGYEEYLSENNEFKKFIEELASTYSISKNRIQQKIHDMYCGLAAYLYYNQMNPKILNDVAISFMCYYRDMKEIINMNGIYLFNHNLDEKYYQNFLRVFDIYKESKDPNFKVIR